jgi:4-hydroxy-tetrahydrodipicolinate synthase
MGSPSVSGSRLRPEGLRGRVIPAVPVPFRSDGTVHQRGQGRYVEHMVGQPVGGVAVWAHTGRGLHLDPGQRAEVLTSWRSGLDGGRVVLAATGPPPHERDPDAMIRSAFAMARQAAELGADGLLVHPPTALRDHPDRDELIVRYHAAVAEAGLPLVLFYLYEVAGGIDYGPELLSRLLAWPEVLGVKVATLDSVMTFQAVANLVRSRHPGKVLVTGEDRFLGYSLMCGADSALIGMAAACTRLQCDMLRSYWGGNVRGFLSLNSPVDDFAQHTFVPPVEGYVLRLLWCLVHEGIIPPEAAHDPWGPRLSIGEFDTLGDCLKRVTRSGLVLRQETA